MLSMLSVCECICIYIYVDPYKFKVYSFGSMASQRSTRRSGSCPSSSSPSAPLPAPPTTSPARLQEYLGASKNQGPRCCKSGYCFGVLTCGILLFGVILPPAIHPPAPNTLRAKHSLTKGYRALLWALLWVECDWLGVVFGCLPDKECDVV